ncbi:MAG TPA: endonuclease/exonuclease/phosphatase family protein [Tepidisphaeraceae bacterium]|nr:endonuclease/exonuclease/phosphatase family protein [Tepidisphaeraceae bacterium]
MSRPPRRLFLIAMLLLAGGCAGERRRGTFELAAQAYEVEVRRPAPRGAMATASRGRGLVVASYNLHQMLEPDALRADLAGLAFVDVWAMQEVPVPRPGERDDDEEDVQRHRDAFRQSMARILPPGTWHLRAVAVNSTGGGGGRGGGRRPGGWTCEGQVVASRLPIRGSAVWELGGEGKRRVALAAFIDHPRAGDVAVVNTDHEPGLFSSAPGPAGNDAQVARLLDHLSRCDRPAIVAGDFNPTGLLWRLRTHGRHVARLVRAMADAGLSTTGHGDTVTFRSGPAAMRLDHIFLRDLRWVAGGVATTARGSDHLPVWCEVAPLRPQPPASGGGVEP